MRGTKIDNDYRIARGFPEIAIWAIVFDTPYEVICLHGCSSTGNITSTPIHTDHPTIESPEEELTILARFANNFHHPTLLHIHNYILYIKPSSPVHSRSEVTDI